MMNDAPHLNFGCRFSIAHHHALSWSLSLLLWKNSYRRLPVMWLLVP